MEYNRNDTLELDLHGLSPDGRTVGRSAEGMTASAFLPDSAM